MGMSHASNHTVTDLMNEADSYHRFWIEERQKRLELEKALKFYADSQRYEGPNAQPIPNDPYAPADLVYRYDVTRDRGSVARKAIAAAR
jgi:hypothetical protein